MLGSFHYLRHHRIEMQIPAQLEKIGISINQNPGIPPLKQVAYPTMLADEVACIPAIYPVHHLQEVSPRRLYYEMVVVIH